MKQNTLVTAIITLVLVAGMVLSSGSIGISVDNDKLPGSDQAIGINYIEHTTPSTAITTTLTPARDLTGDWEGTCVYYWLDMWGERDVKITATCEMSLEQNGNVVTGTFDIYPTKYEDIGEAGYTPPIESHYRVNGIVSGTTLTFDNFADTIGAIGKEQWEFTFTTDMLSGGVTNLDEYSYSGSDSDSNDFKLTRVSTQKQDTGFKLIDSIIDIFYGILGIEALNTDDEKTSSELFEYGYSLQETGNYTSAIAAYDRSLAIDPDNAYAWHGKGHTLYELGRYEEAITALDRALAINPDNKYTWFVKGAALYELGRYEETITALDRTLAIDPDYADVWRLKGAAHEQLARWEDEKTSSEWVEYGDSQYDMEDYSGAITAYDKVLAIDSDYATAWNNKGNALSKLDRYEEAITAYDRSLAIDPDNADAWYNKGAALDYLGRYEEAITAYDRALAIYPDNTYAWNNKGVALDNLGRYEEAITAYDRALAIDSDDADAWYNKGVALDNLGRYEEAITAYDRVLAIDPNFVYAWSNKGYALRKLSQYEEAIAAYDKALAIDPDYAGAWCGKGLTLYELDKYEEAITAYDRALDINSDYTNAWYNKGLVLYKFERYEEAITAFDRTLDLYPDYAYALYNKGFALYILGRYEEAITTFDRILDKDPDDQNIWSFKGLALYELGRYEEAIMAYDRALAIYPDYAYVWNNRGLALVNLSRYEEAITAYDRALAIDPDYADAKKNKDICLNKLDETEQQDGTTMGDVLPVNDDTSDTDGTGFKFSDIFSYIFNEFINLFGDETSGTGKLISTASDDTNGMGILTPTRDLTGTWKTSYPTTFYLATDFRTFDGTFENVGSEDRMVTWIIEQNGNNVRIEQYFSCSNRNLVPESGYVPDISPNFYEGIISGPRLIIKEDVMSLGGLNKIGERTIGNFSFTSVSIDGTWDEESESIYSQRVYTEVNGLKLRRQN